MTIPRRMVRQVIERDQSTLSNRSSIEWERPQTDSLHLSPGPNPQIGTSDWRAEMDSTRLCSIDGCERKHFACSFCQRHYNRWRAHGDPLRVRNGSVDDRLARLSVDAGDCRVWTGSLNRHGYGQITIRPGGLRAAHRVAWERANGPIPEGLLVRHTCDNPPCIKPTHLLLGTTADNVRDKVERGRSAPAGGSNNNLAKLTESDIPGIRERASRGESQRAIAESFGVSQSAIAQVVRRKTWTHVA